MSVRQRAVSRRTVRSQATTMAGLLAVAALAAGCSSQPDDPAAASSGASQAPSSSASTDAEASPSAPATSQASVVKNVADRGVRVDKVVKLTAKDGTFTTVTVRDGKKSLPGTLSSDKTTWTSTAALEPGRAYRARAVAVDAEGVETTQTKSFRTQDLSLDQQTFPSFAPVGGETVGVGMPVIVRFDVPVSDRAAIQKHLTVTNTSHQRGAWRWLSDSEVHWRPATYWKPGTKVTVKADINSVAAGNGVYGQLSRTESFKVGRSVISRVNAQTHQMKTFINGKLAKTTPITTGKAGFTTRSGVKVIVEKFRHKRMNSETVGIARTSSEAYDLDDVEYAMRVTYSGEFLHAAPWSVGQQGYANVSHGCTGMSTSNAAWLYENSKPGDVVEYTGTDRQMTLDNGYGDWNASFAQYKKASAPS
jgi:lipoprotein-anchoring transpeptidase ErfK/SrfK